MSPRSLWSRCYRGRDFSRSLFKFEPLLGVDGVATSVSLAVILSSSGAPSQLLCCLVCLCVLHCVALLHFHALGVYLL